MPEITKIRYKAKYHRAPNLGATGMKCLILHLSETEENA